MKIVYEVFLESKLPEIDQQKQPGMSLVAGKGMRFTAREYEREMWVEDEKETEGGNRERKRRAFMHDWWLRKITV